MAGLDDLISSSPTLSSLANRLGMQKEVWADPELPNNLRYEYSLTGNVDRSKQPLYGLPASTIPKDLPSNLQIYRADPLNKYGGDGIETQPQTRFDTGGSRLGNQWIHKPNTDPETSSIYTDPSKAVQDVYRHARTLGAANKYGYATLSPEEAAAFVLKEGRSDLGYNGDATINGNKKDVEFSDMLSKTYNMHPHDRGFLATLNSKQRVAEKLGIPLAEAWNGTGKNQLGQSGKDYAKNWETHKEAAQHPKNKGLMELIQRAYDDGIKHGFPLKENEYKDTARQRVKVPYKKGGMIAKPLDGGHKLI
jgi:hypothetical protein